MKKRKKIFQWKNGKNLPWPRWLLNHHGTLHCSRNVLNWINRDFVSAMFHVPLLFPKWLASTSLLQICKAFFAPGISLSPASSLITMLTSHMRKLKFTETCTNSPTIPQLEKNRASLDVRLFKYPHKFFDMSPFQSRKPVPLLWNVFWRSSRPLHKSFGEDEAFCEKPEKNQGLLPKAMWVSHLAIQSSSLN